MADILTIHPNPFGSVKIGSLLACISGDYVVDHELVKKVHMSIPP